jgi:hypothetical protein
VQLTGLLSLFRAGYSAAAPYFITFLYLQLLDFLTTVVAIKVGFAESSPFIRWLMQSNMTVGLAESKVVAILLAGLCIAIDKGFLVRWINRWYAAVVVWNLSLMWIARPSGLS